MDRTQLENSSPADSIRASLGTLFDRVPVAMLVVDSAGRITAMNSQAGALLGYAREELEGQLVESVVPERSRASHPAFRAQFFAAPVSRPMGEGRELFARHKDGRELPVEIGLRPIETESGERQVLAAIVDISERKHREERLASALREKDLLLGEIHHRVKNNLQVVDSLLDLQAMRIEDATVREMLRESRDRVRSMSLIHQTLYRSGDFARVDFQVFLEALVPPLVASYGMQSVRVRTEAQAVHLPIEIALPCGLIVNELVTNALKHGFGATGAGELWILLRRESEKLALLSVGNDGAPIPPDLDVVGAPGLGMQIVHALARQIHGRIEIERSLPTVFHLRFPIGALS